MSSLCLSDLRDSGWGEKEKEKCREIENEGGGEKRNNPLRESE